MQTWEYSPEFAIRTYAFILPFTPFGYVAQSLGITKIDFFFFCKVLLGLLFAFSTKRYFYAIRQIVGNRVASYTLLFLLTSPGVFFSATAYLPSALCASFLMLSITAWLNHTYSWAILYGCVAVIWSGWPFVGVLFGPLGVHMLIETWLSPPLPPRPSTATPTITTRLQSILSLLLTGLVVLSVTAIAAVTIDSTMYGKL